jgi:gliding motility-associated-like protein
LTINLTSCDTSQVGTVIDSLTNSNNCDSIVTTITTLNPSFNDTILTTSCLVADTGIVVANDITVLGCDSITTTITTLLLSDTLTINLTSCDTSQVGTVIDSLMNVNGCDSVLTIHTRLKTPLPISNPLQDTMICENELGFIFFDENGMNFIWNDGTIGKYLEPSTSGEYIVEFVQVGTNCLLTDTINIKLENCVEQCLIAFPTGFSPESSSGFNDVLKIITTCEMGFDFFEMKIFNRWGELVFITNDPKIGWNGAYKNEKAPIGSYIYNIEFKKLNGKRIEFLNGNVTLIK